MSLHGFIETGTHRTTQETSDKKATQARSRSDIVLFFVIHKKQHEHNIVLTTAELLEVDREWIFKGRYNNDNLEHEKVNNKRQNFQCS